ncbi:AAA family ATPase [Halalkalibacillus sediminis]|uniref:AAA family ATPase n=1 Tax=Halalkalibacillus sediminis TaxID=2018042 RepID=A0A2I0QRV8_9BACI|nr:DNA topology modulation protein [Halalkalibacillus sediminis]PKR77049.1 AAA family ATPase [Halalkalibacillus sediminis]
MKRIIVLGSSGAGKSQLSRRLGKLMNTEVFHLDSFFWQPGWKAINKDEFINAQMKIVEEDQWIIDGTYLSTLDIRYEKADTIIFLEYPRVKCLYRAISRFLKYRGRKRPDMGKGCPEKIDMEFLKYIWDFPKKNGRKIKAKLSEEEKRTVIHLTSQKETDEFLSNLESYM